MLFCQRLKGGDLVRGRRGEGRARRGRGRKVALRTPSAGGSCRFHGGMVSNSLAVATVEATGVVDIGRGAGVIPLRLLPCGWWRCPGTVLPGGRRVVTVRHQTGLTAPGMAVLALGAGVVCLADARALFPVVAHFFRIRWGGGGDGGEGVCGERGCGGLSQFLGPPLVHLLAHILAHAAVGLLSQALGPRGPEFLSFGLVLLESGSEELIGLLPCGWPGLFLLRLGWFEAWWGVLAVGHGVEVRLFRRSFAGHRSGLHCLGPLLFVPCEEGGLSGSWLRRGRESQCRWRGR